MKSWQVLEQRRKLNKINLENRIREVYQKDNRIAELSKQLRKKNFEKLSLSLSGADSTEISEEIAKLESEKIRLLKENDFPVDYLEMKYHCNICKDMGTVGTNICDCRKQLQIQELYEQTEIYDILKEQNFDAFDLDVFRKDRQFDEEISPYENMKRIKNKLYEYSTNFSNDASSLYVYGDVGTGKTFLLNSIAKEVLDLGDSVIYLTESRLVNDILEYKFAYSEKKSELKPKYDLIMNCDLLIIDDLGSNNINETTNSAIFEVVNTRIVKNLPVIISSNLTPELLGMKYDGRIYSRIIGNFFAIKLYGNDIRMR